MDVNTRQHRRRASLRRVGADRTTLLFWSLLAALAVISLLLT